MLGFLTRRRDERLLEDVIAGHERTLPFDQYTAQGTGTLRMVVHELRRPTRPGVRPMGVAEILSLIALILRLIAEFRGAVSEVVEEVRARRAE